MRRRRKKDEARHGNVELHLVLAWLYRGIVFFYLFQAFLDLNYIHYQIKFFVHCYRMSYELEQKFMLQGFLLSRYD